MSCPPPKKIQTNAAPVVPSVSSNTACPESTSTAPMRSDIEIDPGLLDNTSQNLPLAAPDTENAPPTPEVMLICLQKVPQFLPFASTKTANKLAAQYAA
ncbi:hypothetical protein FRC11_002937, partial [Ceratobasidium sp. 423]